MEKINKPEGLPDCKIINELIIKTNAKTDYEFNYINQLEELRKIISIEVSRINLLFPEYTPHDEQYHLKRLFYVADQMLGEEVIENMNATELFLLSISLYGHDWGMAMSEEEKAFILTGNSDNCSSTVNLLDDEKTRIKEFCRVKNIQINKIEIEDWQEYVRLTHAFRSGKRISKYFSSINSGIGEFASRICEGHWLDFDIIDDHTSYPTDASINREIVNIKALTIYVRLIDLLDLGEDRTPFILWKFVAPRNKFSKLEWSKHRALQAITFPPYQLGRSIQIDGSTDDQNVYMSIMDLKRYVDEQFRHCSDILNRINHNYHKLNISHIVWRIAPRGFEPVAIQFEFDRNRMFDILGDEIYQSNPYVFIRELLQNSIDAIEMRIEILQKKGLSFIPKINFLVTEDDNCYNVQITDNGIGMDEYIIRNYLAIAGKSYYKSIDFQKEGLKMDPISRFGIGVLSCFMIADYIEIQTFRDPSITNCHDPLFISIPSKENYFKIKKSNENLDVGTTFNVFVLKNKLPKNKKNNNTINFNITEYLKKTAGFVKFPITIIENNLTTLINNPNINNNDPQNFNIDYKFPIEKAIYPQNIETVKKYFSEKKIHLKTDLKLDNFDGCLTYLIPLSEDIDIVNSSHSWPTTEIELIDYKNSLDEKLQIKWNSQWISFDRYTNDTKNSIPDRSYNVFMDGILIQDITPPNIEINKLGDNVAPRYYRNSLTESFVNPQLIVNIPKPAGMKIDLARTNIESTERWDKPIWIAFYKYIQNSSIKEISIKNSKEKLLSLSKLMTFYKLTEYVIINHLLSNLDFPLPYLSEDGNIEFKDLKISNTSIIKLAPREFENEYYQLIESAYLQNKKYEGILNLWKGSEAIIYYNSNYNFPPSSLSNIRILVKYFIRNNYYLSSIEFINSPLGNDFPLVLQILKIKPKEAYTHIKIEEISTLDLDKIDDYNCNKLSKILKKEFYSFPKLTKFQKPYNQDAFYAFGYMNFDHVKIKSFVKLCIGIITANQEKVISDEISGKLYDMVNDIAFIKSYYNDGKKVDIINLNLTINKLYDEAIKHNVIKKDLCLKPEFELKDFVKNSISLDKKTKLFDPKIDMKKCLNGKNNWGNLLT